MVILLFATAFAAGAGVPTTNPVERRQAEMEDSKKKYLESLASLPPLNVHRMSQILRFHFEGDMLVASTSLQPANDMTGFRAEITGEPMPMWVSYCQLVANNAVSHYFELRAEFYPDGDTFRAIHLRWRPGTNGRPGELSVEKKEQTGRSFERVLYLQSDSMARLNVFSNGAGGDGSIHTFNLMERDLGSLRRSHPQEVQRWLRPIFHQLRQDSAFAPDLNTAWQVLADGWPVSESTRAAIARLVAKLADRDYRVRKQTCDEMAKLGREGASGLLQLDRGELSAEQNARVDEVISRFRRIRVTDSRRLGASPDFLLDCEYSEDATARGLAAEQLARVLGHSVDLSADAPEAQRYEQVERLRVELNPAVSLPLDDEPATLQSIR
jgi:hypothetical protein